MKQEFAQFFNIEVKSVYNWEADRVRFSDEMKKQLNDFVQSNLNTLSFKNKI